jgi:molybdopterin-containing oxidoreductase family membrane subunit
VLLGIGALSFYTVFTEGLIVTDLSDSIPWGLWITIDLSAIALGAGAFALSAVVYLFKIDRLRPIVRIALLIGLIGYTSALLTVSGILGSIGTCTRYCGKLRCASRSTS